MRIAIIGCGVMGSAFARHFASRHALILCDRNPQKGRDLAQEVQGHYEGKLAHAALQADLLLLAIKPKDLHALSQEISSALAPSKMVVSVLAGTSVAALKEQFPHALIVRTMPNLGLICGEGVVGIADHLGLSLENKQQVTSLLEGLGLCLWVPENKMDAITALSGSGIGFVLVMIEAMIDGGVHLGLTALESREIVLKTMAGAVALMRQSNKHPAELKLQISSPGGTTIAGLNVMEQMGVRAGIIKTLEASFEKALQMMKNPKID